MYHLRVKRGTRERASTSNGKADQHLKQRSPTGTQHAGNTWPQQAGKARVQQAWKTRTEKADKAGAQTVDKRTLHDLLEDALTVADTADTAKTAKTADTADSRRNAAQAQGAANKPETIPSALEFNDPMYAKQWYLINRDELFHVPGGAHMDINVLPAWKAGYSGKGVVSVVVDDGLEITHHDLAPNYVCIRPTPTNCELSLSLITLHLLHLWNSPSFLPIKHRDD